MDEMVEAVEMDWDSLGRTLAKDWVGPDDQELAGEVFGSFLRRAYKRGKHDIGKTWIPVETAREATQMAVEAMREACAKVAKAVCICNEGRDGDRICSYCKIAADIRSNGDPEAEVRP